MENTSVIDIICRQTDYDKETALSKLKEFDNNYQKVIQDYMGIKPKQEKTWYWRPKPIPRGIPPGLR